MRVVAINGSPHRDGNAARSLSRVGEVLRNGGVDFEVIHIGDKVVRGCTACGQCRKTGDGRCAFGEAPDPVNGAVKRMSEADGIVLAAPVHYSGIAGTMKSFLDRSFYVAGPGSLFRHKVGAALAVVRRSGGSSTLDSLNHYLTYSEMIVATSNYWNVIHGMNAGQIDEDGEGLQILDVLAGNMLWVLRMRDATRDSIDPPVRQKKVFTNFVR